MYNFKMLKSEQEKIRKECNFSEVQKFIFNNLAEEKTRLEVYDLVKEKFGLSQATVSVEIRKIVEKMNNYKNGKSFYSHKIYIHKFPNGKKYVGVCQCCEDRWANGRGYGFNKKMYEDIQKYGWDNIEHKILLETTDNELAYKIERILIEELDLVNNGYNQE